MEGEIWTTRLFGKPIVQVVDQLKAQTGIEGILVTRENRVRHTSGDQRKLFWKGRIKNEIYRLSRNQLITINESRFVKLHEKLFASEAEIELVGNRRSSLFNKPEDHELPEAVRRIAEKLKLLMA